MARIAIDAALGSGFGLIRRRPGSVLLWGVVYTVLIAVTFGLLGSYYLRFFTQILANAQLGTEASSSQAMASLMPQMMAMQGWSWLTRLLGLFVGAVLYCAAFRAVLHPEEARFAYLRVGMPELMLFVLWIAACIVLLVAAVIYILVAAALVAALIAMHATAAGVILGVLAGLLAVVAMIWFGLRFSMVGPMMVSDGKFHLFESWTLTKSHAGVLFIVAVCLFVIALVAEMVIMGVLMVVGGAIMTSAAGGSANLLSFFSRPPSEVVAAITPLLILAVVILMPVSGCFVAIWGAPWARAYLDLTTPAPEAPVAV